MKYSGPFWCCSRAPYANRAREKVTRTRTHTSFTRATSEGVRLGREFYCIIKSAAFWRPPISATLRHRVNQTISHTRTYTHLSLACIYCIFFSMYPGTGTVCLVCFPQSEHLQERVCVCFPFRELTKEVERHSLCLVLTSLEFKHPIGTQACFSHHTTCDSHYTCHMLHTYTHTPTITYTHSP